MCVFRIKRVLSSRFHHLTHPYTHVTHTYPHLPTLPTPPTHPQLLVQDEKHLRRVKWQYMVLDEAQARAAPTCPPIMGSIIRYHRRVPLPAGLLSCLAVISAVISAFSV